MAVKVCGLAQKGNFVQKPSSRQRQHASVRIAESLARFLHCSAQPVAQTALRWWQQTRLLSKTAFVLATTNRAIARMLSNQARERVIVAIPHDRLLGEACCAHKTDDISVAISLPFGMLLCNRRSYICFRQAISRSLAVPYSAFSQGSFKSIICAHIHIHTRTHGLFYTRIINP